VSNLKRIVKDDVSMTAAAKEDDVSLTAAAKEDSTAGSSITETQPSAEPLSSNSTSLVSPPSV